MKSTRLLSLLTAVALGTAALRAAPTTGKHSEVLPFIHDDYSKAVASAKAKGVPLFVEAWAPW